MPQFANALRSTPRSRSGKGTLELRCVSQPPLRSRTHPQLSPLAKHLILVVVVVVVILRDETAVRGAISDVVVDDDDVNKGGGGGGTAGNVSK